MSAGQNKFLKQKSCNFIDIGTNSLFLTMKNHNKLVLYTHQVTWATHISVLALHKQLNSLNKVINGQFVICNEN
jgi:hypothetical protein